MPVTSALVRTPMADPDDEGPADPLISGAIPVRQRLVHDTWAARDLPVLDATVSLLERSYMVTVTDIAASTGLDTSVVAQALEALDPVYVDFRKTTTGGDPRFWYVFRVTPEARRAVGQWPTAQALADGLAAELSAAAREADGDRQGLLTYAARLIGDTLRDETLRAARAVLGPAFDGVPVPEKGQPVPPEPPPSADADGFIGLVPLPELPELLRKDWPSRGAPRKPASGAEPAAGPEPRSAAAPASASGPDSVPAPLAGPARASGPAPASGLASGLESPARADAAEPDGADPDGADTDVDLVQSRTDTASAV